MCKYPKCQHSEYKKGYCLEHYAEGVRINNYNFKPKYINFARKSKYFGNFKFGVELEVEFGNSSYNRSQIMEEVLALKNPKLIYAKSDGSLRDGAEFVTHPMGFTLATAFKDVGYSQDEVWGWVNKLSEMGCRSHETSSCGLHIHVNRDAFSSQQIVNRVDHFVGQQQSMLQVFARRANNTYADYNANRGSKYRALNLLHPYTIEFRIFKGTLNVNTLIASIQLVYIICKFCEMYNPSDYTAMEVKNMFLHSIENSKEFYNVPLRELKSYMQERVERGESF